jgi:hypothetical protein
MAMTIERTGIRIRNLGRVSAVNCAAVFLRPNLKIVYQVFHADTAGQESRSFRFHQRKSAFTSDIDPHDPREINDKVTLRMSVTGFRPVGAEVGNARVREPSLENEPLLGISVNSRNLQHLSPFCRSPTLIATRMSRSAILVSPGRLNSEWSQDASRFA